MIPALRNTISLSLSVFVNVLWGQGGERREGGESRSDATQGERKKKRGEEELKRRQCVGGREGKEEELV